MKWNVIELDVDELEECLIMRCSTFEGADHICNILLEHFPSAQFALTQEIPTVHMKDYYPERFKEIKTVLFSKEINPKPNLIVIDGGKK
tara:strand:+ start:76 stop:342 length:267 start_codon:yes stop_codon:yes gene_type:complete